MRLTVSHLNRHNLTIYENAKHKSTEVILISSKKRNQFILLGLWLAFLNLIKSIKCTYKFEADIDNIIYQEEVIQNFYLFVLLWKMFYPTLSHVSVISSWGVYEKDRLPLIKIIWFCFSHHNLSGDKRYTQLFCFLLCLGCLFCLPWITNWLVM